MRARKANFLLMCGVALLGLWMLFHFTKRTKEKQAFRDGVKLEARPLSAEELKPQVTNTIASVNESAGELAAESGKESLAEETMNPLMMVVTKGLRIQQLPRQNVVSSITGPVGFGSTKYNIFSNDNIQKFNAEICPRENINCVVAHPLPESIFLPTVTFCLHSGSDFVSNDIRFLGVWGFGHVYFLWATLVQNPEMQFIDMGANIGSMSLVAARLGRQVIAVEPLQANLNILCKSVILNNVTDKVIVVPYALSDQRTTFKTLSPNNNWGGTWLVKEHNETNRHSETVATILTDDILKFIPFRKAFLKIDIEGHEPKAFRSATQLFDKVYIPVVAMEWAIMGEAMQRNETEGPAFVLQFLYDRGYSAFNYDGKGVERRTSPFKSILGVSTNSLEAGLCDHLDLLLADRKRRRSCICCRQHIHVMDLT